MKFTVRTIPSSRRIKALAVVATFLFAINIMATAQTETVLYSFAGGADAISPTFGLVRDPSGNLYGATTRGGTGNAGTVFEVSPNGTETVLYTFTNSHDGAYPRGGIVRDEKGNLYGTSLGGYLAGFGTVYRLSPSGIETVLHLFTGGADGGYPQGSLVYVQGALYGTTAVGGTNDAGTVFEIAPGHKETVLHSFTGGSDGANPGAGLIRDSDGNLYGTTTAGGASGHGTVFKVASDGTVTALYSFTEGAVGNGTVSGPVSSLVRDKQGNLYGTTELGGGAGLSTCPYACGSIYEVTPEGVETVLHAFAGGADGALPNAGLVRDLNGNFYGTTVAVGTLNGTRYFGTVFKLTVGGKKTVLHYFTGGADGGSPDDSLAVDAQGNLYGTTVGGGAFGDGTVFEITP
jgi:uncharacterized repeat protein (TIGR03803 family)